MKAIIHTQYGPPEVATLKDIPQPIPATNELLLKVMASTVNRTDSGFRSAEYFVSRFWSGLFRPKHQTLGCEFAGIVEAIGKDVTCFKVGDKIFGYNDKTFGGHAEYLTIAETASIATLPKNFSFEQATALTEGAHYALGNIKAAKVQAGQNVLVYGATGAIGSAAVQLLKQIGTNITAVCGTQHVELVKSLGAEVVVDYQTQDFTQTSTKFEFIFDAVGKSSYSQCKPLLTKKGIYVSTELGKNGVNLLYALTTPLFGGRKLLFPIPSICKEDVEHLKSLAENADFTPLIDPKSFTLEQIVEAYRYVETGQKIGNVLLKVTV